MTRERIEGMREVILPFVKKRLLETNYEGLGKSDAEEFTRDFNEILDLATKALEQEPRLIPVSERLPTKEEYIANNGLFIVTDGNRTYAEYFDFYNPMKYFVKPTIYGLRVDRCVTAWMPLPSSYEQGVAE